MQATVRTTAAEDRPDVATMRETAHHVLGPDNVPNAVPPAGEELDTLTAALRGHIELLVPEVERAARRLPENAPTRSSALACVGEASSKLRAPELGFAVLAGSVMYARRLARVLVALCDHYETVIAGVEQTPEQAAFVRLAEHCLTCSTCRAMDDQGVNVGLLCEEETRLYEEYRRARGRAAAARRVGHGHRAEVSA
ncbi:DUF6415 family natural product biosynthesis protein [Streptomyces sp. NPDC006372]|uniref:DUF6415 family natural product biosynthesis protein n=1 Tax=Streptomyces sp. NPDC006372 TaxID=3155599 RepID=UPI0033AB0BFE